MTTHRLWYSTALLILAPTLTLRAADKEPADEPLPPGARARLGAGLCIVGPRGGLGSHLLPPDFRTFLTGGWTSGRPRFLDARTGKASDVPGFPPAEGPRRPDGHTIKEVSADGKRAVADKNQDTYLVFEIATGKVVGAVRHDSGNASVSLSADGKVLAFDTRGKGATHEVVVWNLDGNAQLPRVTGLRGLVVTTVLSPDGKTLLTSSAEFPKPTVVQLWEVVSGKSIATLPNDYVGGPAVFSPDGKTLATADDESGTVQLWNVATGKPGTLLLGRSKQLVRLAFSPDGKTLAGASSNWAIERWALSDGKLLKPTPFPAADLLPYAAFPTVNGLSFADNDRVIAWGELWDAALMWEAPGGKLFTPITGHVGEVNAVRFTAGGKEVLTAGVDRRVLRWNAATGLQTGVVAAPHPEHQFDHVMSLPYHHLSPDGTRGLRDWALFDVAAGEELFSLPIRDATPSADFRRVAGFRWVRAAANTPVTYEVWDLKDRQRTAQLEAPANVVQPNYGAIAFSPDNSRLVTVSVQGAGMGSFLVVGWDVRTGKRLGELREPTQWGGFGGRDRPHLAPAGNNSGVVLATADGKLWVADYERGTRGETLAELTGPQQRFTQQRFTHPTFSPDGKTFAVGAPTEKSDAYEVRVYDWPRGKLRHTFVGHRGPVTALVFSPDGKTLASGSADGSVLLWDTAAVLAPK